MHYLYFLQSASTAYNCVIKTFDSTGSLIQSVIFGTTFNSTQKMQYVGVGTHNFANLTGAELRFSASVGLPVISAATTYYTAQIFNSGSQAISEAMTFYLDSSECAWETPYRLCWLNKQGGYDFFTFYWNSKKQTTYVKSDMMRKSWEWSGTSAVYNSYQRGKIQNNTIATDKITINSGWITEEQSTWLEQLVASPDVFLVDNTNNLTAIVVKTPSYDFKTLEMDTLFNLSIEVELSYNRYRQQA